MFQFAVSPIITDRSSIGQVKIDILPDDVLLEIFSFYLIEDPHFRWNESQTWHVLIHVCRRWRRTVFASPRRLDLRICCTTRTRMRDMLHIWPALPLVVRGDWYTTSRGEGTDNIVAALEHNDRVCEISLAKFSSSMLERIAAEIQEPFPALTRLLITSSSNETSPAFPEAFLGGSTSHLRSCVLQGVAFLGIRNLLSSANHLVTLRLWRIPHSGYISPEEMVTCLSAMPNLKSLSIEFRSPRSRPDQANRHPQPLTRVVLPSLTYFWFKGVSEYLEDFVSRIDVAQLDYASITFFNQLIFDIPRLHDFFARTETFKAHSRAAVEFNEDVVQFNLKPRLLLRIICKELDWQLSSMAQVCGSLLPPFPTLERLDICEGRQPQSHWQDDMETSQWLDLLHPFAAVKDLYLDKKVSPRVSAALHELVGERVTEELPVLKNLFIEGLFRAESALKAIVPFYIARHLSGLPVVARSWEERS